MMLQLSSTFGISTLAVAAISGFFYYGYFPFSLVAGAWEIAPRQVSVVGSKEPARCSRHRGDLHRNGIFSGVASRNIDRRDADVWNGRWVCRAIGCWTDDERRPLLEKLLDKHGYHGLGIGLCAIASVAQSERNSPWGLVETSFARNVQRFLGIASPSCVD